jgi:transposase
LDHPAVLDLLETWPTPATLTTAGKARVRTRLLKKAPRLGSRLTEEIIFAALAAQTVVVTGTNAAGVVLPRLVAQLAALRQQRTEVAEKVEELVAAHPLSKVLTTMPGVGVRTCARILTEVVGKDFPTAGHLASYAGLAPVTGRSGTSIRGEHPPRGGNKVLKRALFLSALLSPLAVVKHDEALIALARRRVDVLYAMLRDNKPYAHPTPAAA